MNDDWQLSVLVVSLPRFILELTSPHKIEKGPFHIYDKNLCKLFKIKLILR